MAPTRSERTRAGVARTQSCCPVASTSMDTSSIQGINVDSVTTWFTDHADATAPLTFDLIPGGRSNLTYRVRDAADGDWVLRRPPLGMVLATAHDMEREHRIISALAETDVPVAPALGLETDDAVNG